MKVSGFTFVKDAVKYHYPIVETIRSILPVCDEIIVNIGLPDTDGTSKYIKKNIKNKKLKMIYTEWDPLLKVKGRIMAQQTNIALYQCTGDWCIYLQADEVLHESDYKKLLKSMKDNLKNDRVEALLLNYIHFFGSYKTYVDSYHWYQKEVRILKNHLGITSWRDAQGFRLDGKKLNVKQTECNIFHYGWVRPPEAMIAKKAYQDSLHHKNRIYNKEIEKKRLFFDFINQIDPFIINDFKKTHPEVMKDKVKKWKYVFDKSKSTHKLSSKEIRHRVVNIMYRIFKIKIGEYRNYKLIK